MHLLAESCILKGLKAAGILTGEVEEMLSARVGALFMPHGAMAASSLVHLVPHYLHEATGPYHSVRWHIQALSPALHLWNCRHSGIFCRNFSKESRNGLEVLLILPWVWGS